MARVYNGMRGINIPWLYLISGHIVVEVWPGIQCTRLNERPNVSGKLLLKITPMINLNSFNITPLDVLLSSSRLTVAVLLHALATSTARCLRLPRRLFRLSNKDQEPQIWLYGLQSFNTRAGFVFGSSKKNSSSFLCLNIRRTFIRFSRLK
jgi:hypothetical protein